MAGGQSRQSAQQEIPPELRPLMQNTAGRLSFYQSAFPLENFFGLGPQTIHGPTGQESNLINQLASMGAQTGPTQYERQGANAATAGLNRANVPVALMNAADQQGLGTLGTISQLGATQLRDPDSDRHIYGELGRASQISGEALPGLTHEENQALTTLDRFGQLANTQLATRGAQEDQALGALGHLGTLAQRDFDPLSGEEQQALGQLGELGQLNQQQLSTVYAPEQQALGVLQPFVGGEVGQSPATQAAMQAYYNQIQPQLQSQLAQRGLERSGAAAAALTQGAERAYVPLVQQELAQRMQAVPLLQQQGAVQGAREREDLSRQLQAGMQLAGQTSQIGAAGAARERGDVKRQMGAYSQLAGQLAGLGATEQARIREDLNRQLVSHSQLAGQRADIGQTLANRAIQTQGQRFGQAAQLGSQYQDLSQMLAARSREDLNRRIAAEQFNAGQQFDLGRTITGREETNRAAAVNAAFQQAGFLGNLGNTIAQRDFAEAQGGLQAAGIPREILDRQGQANRDEMLRQQALAEQILLAPVSGGVLTSGIGQSISGRQSGLIPGVYK